MFSEYKYQPDEIKALVLLRTNALEANNGFSDLLRFGLGVVADRLAREKLRYKDYGPYWFALKELLNEAGYELGQQSDPLVCAEYRGETGEETLIMADEFRTEYLRTQFVGTNQFVLDDKSGEFWVLFDPDMEGVSV